MALNAPTSDREKLISRRTLAHYEACADVYRAATWGHNVSQNVHALLAAIEGPPPYHILDLGCGPGRDLVTFKQLGHHPVGLDGCASFVAMAQDASGCEVWQQDLLGLQLPAAHFDGIFANAVLFHVPTSALPRVVQDLHLALKPQGVLCCSNPRGRNEEGWVDQRYACFWDLPTWRGLVEGAGFTLLHHYFRPPGRPCHQQPWLVTVWRKAGEGD